MEDFKIWPSHGSNPAFISLKWNKIDECFDEMRKRDIRCISINSFWGWKKGKKIDFLAKYPWVEGISVVDEEIDISVINELRSIKWLQLTASKYKGKVDFSNFPELNVLFCLWNNKDYSNLNSCKECQEVDVWKFVWNDFQLLKEMTKLRKISLNYGNLQSLNGIENFSCLEDLSFYSMPHLNSLGGLQKVAGTLERLSIQKCKKINDYNSLKELKNLRAFLLSESSAVDSVEFIHNMQKLDYAYIGVEVLDKKVSVLKERDFGFKKSKNY